MLQKSIKHCQATIIQLKINFKNICYIFCQFKMQKFVFLLCCMDASHALNTSPTSIMFYQCFLPTGGLLIHLPFSIFWWTPVCHFDEVYRISVFFHGYCFLCPVLETFAYAHVLDFPHMSGFNWFAPLSSARATFLSSTHLGSPPQYQALVPIPARQRQHKSGPGHSGYLWLSSSTEILKWQNKGRRLVKTQSCLDSVSN